MSFCPPGGFIEGRNDLVLPPTYMETALAEADRQRSASATAATKRALTDEYLEGIIIEMVAKQKAARERR